MASLRKPYVTPEQYLAYDREAEEKSEYIDGEMFAMSGGSICHSQIQVNLYGELRSSLRGRPCQPLTSDIRVKVEATSMYAYPDVSVVCGEIATADERRDVINNPTVLIEVLSPSTELYDRTAKFAHYRRIDTLREFVLVSQDKPMVERFRRQDDDNWLYTAAEGLDAVVALESIGCTLTLADIYDRIDFEEGTDAMAGNAPAVSSGEELKDE